MPCLAASEPGVTCAAAEPRGMGQAKLQERFPTR
jgi:hypothetical protein